jgi:DNA-binding response OmpR family regulator
MSNLCFPFPPGGRILVVDDDPADRMLLKRLLGSQGYDVREVADGESALAELRRDPPDLVILDILLPGVDGYDVCRRLKGDPRTRLIPVVMITGLDHFEARLRGVDLGVDDFLVKPYRFEELRARVRSLLSLKRFTDELEHAEAVLAAWREWSRSGTPTRGTTAGAWASMPPAWGRPSGWTRRRARGSGWEDSFTTSGKSPSPTLYSASRDRSRTAN